MTEAVQPTIPKDVSVESISLSSFCLMKPRLTCESEDGVVCNHNERFPGSLQRHPGKAPGELPAEAWGRPL